MPRVSPPRHRKISNKFTKDNTLHRVLFIKNRKKLDFKRQKRRCNICCNGFRFNAQYTLLNMLFEITTSLPTPYPP